ncbi:Hypothetical predicted protein, partial [Pelobates cultripes]
MADATRKPANTGECGERINDTLTKLDEILAAFWAKISERALSTAKAKRTNPAPLPQAITGPKGGHRPIATRGSPKRHRRRDRRHKQKCRACPMKSTCPHLKPRHTRTGHVAPSQRRPPDETNPHHHKSETWHITRHLSL